MAKYSTVIMIVPSIAETDANGHTFLKNFNNEELEVIGKPQLEYTLSAETYTEAVSLSLDQIKTDLRKTGVNVDEFYNECKKTKQEELIKAQKRAKVVTKTAEGRSGVAIMTGSEAERTNGEKPTIKSKKIARHIHTIK